MLGWMLLAALFAAAVITIYMTYINKDTAHQAMKQNNIKKAMVKSVMKDGSVVHVKMDALKDDDEKVEVEIEAEDYNSSQIYEGLVLYA